MRTKIGPDNPHACNRYGFAWENVPGPGEAHLDFGCHEGEFLDSLRAKGVGRLVGVDASAEAIEAGRRRFPDLELVHHRDGPAPFADREFSSITVLDVVEHVSDPIAVVKDLHRMLRDDGPLIVTVARQHIFSFLDKGNFKFMFPRLHRWWYCRNHSEQEYQGRYVSNRDGMVGDVSAEKRWHEHFSHTKLGTVLARCGFDVARFDGAGLLARPIALANYVPKKYGLLQPAVRHLHQWDSRHFESTNLFCLARKAGSDSGD